MPIHGFRSPAYMGFEWKPIIATGGTISTYTSGNVTYKVHQFKTVGTSTFTITDPGSTGEVEYLVIAGGGGSGASKDDVTLAGGGGAGGYRCNVQGEMSGGGQPAEERMYLTAGAYTVKVGDGGSGGTGGTGGGNNGGNSQFHTIISTGGGGRTSYFTKPANPGGSGGGCGNGESDGGAGEFGQGYDGGYSGKYGTSGQTGGTGAGGGGGAGGPGYPGIGGAGTSSPDQGELKANVACASTENVNRTSPPSSIDGVTLTEGMRVLLKDQTAQAYNGIYVYSGGTLSRSSDMNAAAECAPGSYTEVTGGTVNAGTKWGLAPARTLPTLNTTPLIWVQNSKKPPAGGNGGAGVTSSITGSAVARAGGGGGSSSTTAGTGTAGGANGRTGTNAGIAGTANTGGGAGGSAFWSTDGSISAKNGAKGGSGIVVIRYPYSYS